jgi:hypothetical protein
LKQYDNSFKGLRRARFSKVPCDWGYDLSDGAEALLPGLAPGKRLAQAARFRAMAALDANQFYVAKDDLISAFVLGRNLSRDGILISALGTDRGGKHYRVGGDGELLPTFGRTDRGAGEGIRFGTAAGHHCPNDPDREQCFLPVDTAKCGRDYRCKRRQTDLFWDKFAAYWNPLATDSESNQGPQPSAAQVRQATSGRTDELLKLVNEMPAYYAEMARVMDLPYVEYKKEAPILFAKIEESPNPFIQQFFRVFRNVRPKEFSAMVRLEMVRAAAAYKRGGTEALKAVQDPLIGGAFEFSRVEFEGVARGFRLKSKERFRDFDEVMIFLEKPGKHFRLDGKSAGTSR